MEPHAEGTGKVPVPAPVVAHAQEAAWVGLGLENVLTTWIGACRVLGQLVLAALGSEVSVPLLRALHHAEGDVLERLVRSLTGAYMAEYDKVSRSASERREALILKLLRGEDLDAPALAAVGYEFDRWHLGIVAWGTDARATLRALAGRLGRDLLVVETPDIPVAAWLASSSVLAREELDRELELHQEHDVTLAAGAPARGLAGWRLTHDEARAALPVALRGTQMITYCADVLLEAAVLQSATIATSLTECFLAPLDGLKMDGRTARQTLRAYFACGRSVSSTASLLKVTRKTVERRISQIEGTLGRSLRNCFELEVALRLEATSATAV
jgi:hypothetical protein